MRCQPDVQQSPGLGEALSEIGSTVQGMGFGYRKSFRIGPVRLTASKRGLSESVGPISSRFAPC